MGFSIGMGIFIKTFAIAADLITLLLLVSFEIVLCMLFFAWPVFAMLWILS